MNCPDAQTRRAFALALVDGTGTGAHHAATTVLVTQRYGIAAAGVVALAATGRLAGMALILRYETRAASEAELARLFRTLVQVMALASILTIVAAAWAPVWVVLLTGSVWAATNSASSSLAVSAVPREVIRYAPWSLNGAAIGATLVGAAIAASPLAGVIAGVLVELAQLLEPRLARPWSFPAIHGVPLRSVLVSMGRGFTMAALTYGPVLLYAALTTTLVGPVWVGPAMAAYAVGSLCAGRLDQLLPCWRRWPTLLVLAAASLSMWLLAVHPLGLIGGRFVGGALMFAAGGRLLRSALGEDGARTTTKLAATTTGLGIGAGVSAAVYGLAVDAFGLSHAVLGGVVVTLGVVGALSARARKGEHRTADQES